MLRYRNAQMAAGKDDPGPAAALEAIKAGAAAPARTPARMASYERDDAAEREAALNVAARELCDLLCSWCDTRRPPPSKEAADEFFRKLDRYAEMQSGRKLGSRNSAFAARLRPPAPPAAEPAGFVVGRRGQRFSLAEVLAPVHLSGTGPVAFSAPSTPENAS